jgi:hypothetical protein
MNIDRLFSIGFCLLLAACGSSSEEPADSAGNTSNNSNNGGSSNNSSDDAGAPGGSSNGGSSDGGTANEGGAENGGSSNVDPNEVPTGNRFIGTGTWDGVDSEFDCDSYVTGEGGIAQYVEAINLYQVQCRSTDGNYQIRISIANPMAGETTDHTTDGGVSFGDIAGSNASANWNTTVTNRISIETVDDGAGFSGSFEAEWDEGPGDDFLSGPPASCSGVFSAVFE